MTLSEAQLAFRNSSDIYKGYVALQRTYDAKNLTPDYDSVEAIELSSYNVDILNDILELTIENGAELIIVLTPYDAENEKHVATFKAEKEWAEENGVTFIDYSLILDKIGLDPSVDYYDSAHLNVTGSTKLSRHLGEFFKSKGVTANPNANTDQWTADYNAYKNKFQ